MMINLVTFVADDVLMCSTQYIDITITDGDGDDDLLILR